jgi:dTDP-N-acetylfucosamine:lipid II N-acetylfucosaminyltransferase
MRMFKRKRPRKLKGASLLTRWHFLTQPVKYVHIMHNDKFNKDFINLVNKKCLPQEHLFLYYGGYDYFEIPIEDNVFIVRKEYLHSALNYIIPWSQKIILHGLFEPDVIQHLMNRKSGLDKCYWVLWGGDMDADHSAPEEYLTKKRQLVRNLGGIITATTQDYEIARQLYQFEHVKHVHGGIYLNPLNADLLNRYRPSQRDPQKPITILANHSADRSTVELLKTLAKFRQENIRVHTILSYSETEVTDEIVSLGAEIFGDKFAPVKEYLSPEKYAQLLGDVDILILNQPRQQGYGNIAALLYLGAKLYIRSDVSSWQHFTEKVGVKIFDTLELPNQDFETFITMDEPIRMQNIQTIACRFDEEHVMESWSALFPASS